MGPKTALRRLELSTGIALTCVASGGDRGIPVILLHAWGESRGAFDRLVAAVPASVPVLAVDQRGHGDADVPASGYGLTDFADDIEALMDAAGLSSAVLVGASSGGYVAQQVAVTHPQRVAGLVLVGCPRSLQGRPTIADEIDGLIDPVQESWVRQSLSWFPRFHVVPQWYIDDRVRDGTRLSAHVWRETFQGLCAATPPTEAGTITAPTLVIWGDRDELLSRDQQEALVSAIPGSRLVTYENTGHLVLWEEPEGVARDLTAFVEGLAPALP
ncbi:alpha/beta fold hydrolase [Janibacter sp. G1551]|uniref:alpha/beta fold hydrolase n=1 Tax=Janibacter sp. G1551 TaxID=3420440 RepID=UPI003D0916BD